MLSSLARSSVASRLTRRLSPTLSASSAVSSVLGLVGHRTLFSSSSTATVNTNTNSSSKASAMSAPQHYDFAVIGGGSGGMAAAKEAAALGAKVVLFDFVKPSTQGTKWGLGGTCVNVGCVPKKLFHFAAGIGASLHLDAAHMGFQGTEKVSFDWSTLTETVQNHVRQLNFAYRNGLRSGGVTYVNAHAAFAAGAGAGAGAKTLEYALKGQTQTVTADKVLIAVGGRPQVPADVPGAREFALTSDDLFSLDRSPGKTLVVGASYIALECAGLLTGLGFDTTVAVRSILLRGFDRQCADKIGELMKAHGTKFVNNLPSKLTKDESTGKITATFADGTAAEYDTVLYATGRYADTKGLGLANVGVEATAEGKFKVSDTEETNVAGVYAVGDILYGRPELTPVAIRTGELLARRLFGGATRKMDWNLIPTAVFTPAEYGSVGLSEEAAVQSLGAESVETYLWEWTTLEHAAVHREKPVHARADEMDADFPASCLAKLVTVKDTGKVIGFHFVGPNAGEVTQGAAVAMRAGATKEHFDDTIGIHPTDAEAFTTMTVTRSSGLDFVAAGGCGGGKCG